MILTDAEFQKFQERVFSIFAMSLLICLNFVTDHRNCLYSHFGRTRGLCFASFEPFVMTFGYRNAIQKCNSLNWSR